MPKRCSYMKALISFFLDWKVKLCIVLILLSSLYFWHVSELKIAVNKAEMTLVQKYQKEITILEGKAKHSTEVLTSAIESNNKERKIELQNSTRKYNDLKRWLHNLPSKTSASNLPGDTQDSEARAREVIAELRRADAIALAEYSLRAEEVRVHLVQCYKDYDSVKDTLDAFREDNRLKE